MSSCRQRKTVISDLPADVKERILECMPTPLAARTALLSTHWKVAWLRLGRLVLDWDFFQSVEKSKAVNKRVYVVNIINNILMLRAAPVKKFKLEVSYSTYPKPHQSDLEKWCLFLSRNGIEDLILSIPVYFGEKYKLPLCLVSCKTIKNLRLVGLIFHCPVNAQCLFPGLMSSEFKEVEFSGNVNKNVYSLPKLENLAFDACVGAHNYEIIAPKLKSLSALGFRTRILTRLSTLHLNTIKTLCLSVYSLRSDVAVGSAKFPTAKNLQVVMLHDFSFACGNHLTLAKQLLKKSPKLCVLEITLHLEEMADFTLLEHPEGEYLVKDDLKMLVTLKIEGFRGTKKMIFVKSLLSKSPALENVVIREAVDIDASLAFQAPKELLSFPCQSPKAQLGYKEYKP